MHPYVLLDDQKTGEARYFTRPVDIISAYQETELEAAFSRIEEYHNSGHYLAGYVSYELGYALEPALAHFSKKTDAPLIQIGVFKDPPRPAPANCLYRSKPALVKLTPKWSLQDYLSRYKTIKDYIKAGDVYQINLTFPLIGKTHHTAKELYASFRRAQPGRYGSIVRLGGADIISFSPELFFEKKGRNMRMRPMKGTRPRLSNIKADNSLRAELLNEPKSKAENLMIVDLLRNDLSKLCVAGSVKVPELFTVETYPTLHQMISEVTATLRLDVKWKDIFKGLFPCGSITGAPKIRAMEIIESLETQPRSAYCGAIGYIAPSGEACFNVAIRTLQLNAGKLRYDVGSGVVLDSNGEDEYQECLLKSEIFTRTDRALFETFRWTPKLGYVRASEHKQRLLNAARHYNIPLTPMDIDLCLKKNTPTENHPKRIRLSLTQTGKLDFSSSPLDVLKPHPLQIAISRYALSVARQITDHKVENRDFYDGERTRLQAQHEIDEVIFLDKNNHVMEGSFTSLFIKEGEQLYTPKRIGILPGILRQSLIQSGEAIESDITIERLLKADQLYVGNSLRGLIPAQLYSPKRI